MSQDSPQILSQPVYLLGISAAILGIPPNTRPGVLITVRPDEGRFTPCNLAVTVAQAARLRDDLITLFRNYECLKSAPDCLESE